MHVSPWSSPLVVSVAATTAIALDIQIRNTLLTQHGRRGSYRALSVALYRTAVDGAAAGVIRYYRLTGYGIDSLRFDTTDERITYTDDDADPTGLGLACGPRRGACLRSLRPLRVTYWPAREGSGLCLQTRPARCGSASKSSPTRSPGSIQGYRSSCSTPRSRSNDCLAR